MVLLVLDAALVSRDWTWGAPNQLGTISVFKELPVQLGKEWYKPEFKSRF